MTLEQLNNLQKEDVKELILEFIKTEKITQVDRIENMLNDKGLYDRFENMGDSFSHPQHPEIIYWLSNNHLLIQALEELVAENRVTIEKSDAWRYGKIVGHPIARKIKSYSSIRWYPISLKINTAVESNSSKLEQEMEDRINNIKDNVEIKDKVQYMISNVNTKLNSHYAYCTKNNIPYIVASGRKIYKVSLDMYHTPFNLTKDGRKAMEYAIRWELQQNPKHLQKKFDYNVSPTYTYVYPIRKERLEQFCQKIFYLSCSYRDFVDEHIKNRYQASSA